MNPKIKIIADYREKRSGIPDLLLNKNIDIAITSLPVSDYLINDMVLVERKAKEDFIASIIKNHLFVQCKKLKKTPYYHLLIIEGNPYTTAHKINYAAIKGALLSISVSWQIPVFFSKDKNDTANILVQIGNQNMMDKVTTKRKGYKPKRQKRQQLYFLQGLPSIGPSLALRLIEHFGSIEKIMLASDKELRKIQGIGNSKACEIRKFIIKT